MIDIATHEQEVTELFEKLTVEIPGGQGLRAINRESFKLAIDQMMNKAFYYGGKQVLQSTEDILDRVFKDRI